MQMNVNQSKIMNHIPTVDSKSQNQLQAQKSNLIIEEEVHSQENLY